jgi:hypothetical protein
VPFSFFKKKKKSALRNLYGQAWWCMPIIPALRRVRKEDHKFEASLSYIASSKKISYKKSLLFIFQSKGLILKAHLMKRHLSTHG